MSTPIRLPTHRSAPPFAADSAPARTRGRVRSPAPALALTAALLVAACDGGAAHEADADADGAIGLAPPAALLQSRAIDRTRLEPRVSIVDGPTVRMTRDGDRWRGTVAVAPDRDYTLDILWIEIVTSGERSRELPLATYSDVVSVGPDGALFTVDADRYDLDLDFDDDGTTNLAEREANTDPFGDGFAIDAPGDSGTGVPVAPFEPAPGDDAPAPSDPPPDDAPVGGEPDGPTPAPDDPDAGEPIEPDPADTAEPNDPVDAVIPVDPGDSGESDEPMDRPGEPEPIDEPGPTDPGDEPVPAADADVVIPRIASGDAPAIDGRNVVTGAGGLWGGEWAGATAFDTGGGRLFVDRLMIDKGTDEVDGQAFRAWGAMHDGEYLYVVVTVDDDGRRVRDADRPDEIWRDDSLEVYVDGDNSKRTSYGDGNDSSRILPLLAPGTTRTGTSEGIVSAFLSVDAPIRIDFATGPGIGPDGLRRARFEQDVYELRIDLASAGIVPGRPFGFELQVNDDDDGGDREAKWGWAHPSRGDEDVDFTYLDPSFMGTAILE